RGLRDLKAGRVKSIEQIEKEMTAPQGEAASEPTLENHFAWVRFTGSSQHNFEQCSEHDLGSFRIWDKVGNAAAEARGREKLAQWMMQHSFATGHGDTLADLLKELDWQVAALRNPAKEKEK